MNNVTFSGNALDSAESAFGYLVIGPEPLFLDGPSIHDGLPDRTMDLLELRDLILRPGTSDAVKDTV